LNAFLVAHGNSLNSIQFNSIHMNVLSPLHVKMCGMKDFGALVVYRHTRSTVLFNDVHQSNTFEISFNIN
jgi:hypothetical protein